MLYLDESRLVGRGTERTCFRHPREGHLCIKVVHNQRKNKRQNEKDFVYFRRLERRGIDWSHLPRCHGWARTNLGLGLVFDFLQDTRGEPLPRLDTLLAEDRLGKAELDATLAQLHDYLHANRLFTSDLRASNIVCNLDKTPPYPFLIDGVGDRDFIKLASLSQRLGRAKIERQWARFLKRLEKLQDTPK